MTRRELLATLTLGLPALPRAVRRPQAGDTIWVWVPPSERLLMQGEWLKMMVCERCLHPIRRDGMPQQAFWIPHPVGVLDGKFQIQWRWTRP
jgi:hypothetical protein